MDIKCLGNDCLATQGLDRILAEQKQIREKSRIIKAWTSELKHELKLNIFQTHDLLELKERLDSMVKNISFSLEIAQENLLARETLKGIDDDGVEEFLLKEIEALRYNDEILLQELEKLNFQLYHLRSTRYEIEVDIVNKKNADRNEECAKLLQVLAEEIGTSLGAIHMPPPVGRNNRPSVWIPTTQSLIQKSQDERRSSFGLSTTITHIMIQAANKCFHLWNETNAALSRKVSSILKVKDGIEEQLNKNKKEIKTIKCQIEKLEDFLASKRQQMNLIRAKLEKKLRDITKNADLCKDTSMLGNLREYYTLKTNIESLTGRLSKLEKTLEGLSKTKSTLEHDLKFKQIALLIDREKCLRLRHAFPISTFAETRFPKKEPIVIVNAPMIR